jgi:membrane protein YqaA with SNARE-associated domain
MYVVVFVGSLAVDLVPLVAPPAWTLMAFLLVKYHLNPWLVLAVGVPGSALGRFLFSLYIPKLSDKVIAKRKKEELRYVGKKLDRPLWQTWLFVLLYTVSPLSTSALFTAAGITKVPVMRLIPPFMVGKFVSDGAMVLAGTYAAGSLGDVLHGVLSWKSVLTGAITVVVTGALMFVDWHAVIARKKLRFNFSIWK